MYSFNHRLNLEVGATGNIVRDLDETHKNLDFEMIQHWRKLGMTLNPGLVRL